MAVTAETELDNIEVPETNTEINNLVNQLESAPEIALVTQTLPTQIDVIISQSDTQISEPTTEEVVERAQEIIEEVVSAPAGVETIVEETLP